MVLNRRPRNNSEAGDEFISDDDVLVWNSSSYESEEEEGSSVEEAEEVGQAEAEARAEARARHRARMRALLDERDQLRMQALQEEILLQQEIARRDEAFRRVQMMEERRSQLLLQREQDLAELATLDEGDNVAAEVGVDAGNEAETE